MVINKRREKIPATMVSQHPDHASRPYWHTEEFIGTSQESYECYISFSELGVSEYKWDWEGKLVDESVIERLLSDYYAFFKKNPLGKEKFLTFRLPNPKVETEHRLGRAFMGILSAATLAAQVGVHAPPFFEVILPMTETASEMISIQEAFSELAQLKHPLYKFDPNTLKHILLIPLFEQVGTIINSHEILAEYVKKHKKIFGVKPIYIRPYVARSDPALNSGLIPTVIAIKIALSRYHTFEKETGIKLYPIIGSASLPFRGGLTPLLVKQFANEYKGVRTALLQSAFRYDYDQEDVLKGIRALERLLPQGKAPHILPKDEQELIKITKLFEKNYKKTIEGIAPTINHVSQFIPKRRERVQHVGLFGYSRGVGKVKLPRAIGFTAALYSLGVPPELIGTGRGLAKLTPAQKKLLEKTYINLKFDLKRAGAFLHKDVLASLAQENTIWKQVVEDVAGIEDYLGEELKPTTLDEQEHHIIVEKIFHSLEKKKNPKDLISRAAIVRRSLG